MICKHCNKEHERRSDYCSRECYNKINGKKYNDTTRVKYKKDNVEKIKKYSDVYNKNYTINNKEKIKKSNTEWRLNNKDYQKMRYANEINYKIERVIRSRILDVLKGNCKKSHSLKLLGCNGEFFRGYLENLLLPEMSWENYGEEWEVDHIRPCHIFNLTNLEGQEACFHYTNQRPLFKTTEIAMKYGYNDIIGNRNRSKKLIEVKNGNC